jgi:hypothetical protein
MENRNGFLDLLANLVTLTFMVLGGIMLTEALSDKRNRIPSVNLPEHIVTSRGRRLYVAFENDESGFTLVPPRVTEMPRATAEYDATRTNSVETD